MSADLPRWSSRNTSDLVILMGLGLVFFTLPFWGAAVFAPWRNFWMLTQGPVIFQFRLLNQMVPQLIRRWPGPLLAGGALTQTQILCVGLIDGFIGLFLGWLVFQMADNWLIRLVWIVLGWLIWAGILYLFAKASMLG